MNETEPRKKAEFVCGDSSRLESYYLPPGRPKGAPPDGDVLELAGRRFRLVEIAEEAKLSART
jgi:hypothetical protein